MSEKERKWFHDEANMADRITIDLPAGVLRRAELPALRAGRPIEGYLAETLQHALELFGDLGDAAPDAWSDEEVLEVADSHMPKVEDRRLSELLDGHFISP